MQTDDDYEGKYKLPNKRVAQAEMKDRIRWTEHWSDIMEVLVEDKKKLLKQKEEIDKKIEEVRDKCTAVIEELEWFQTLFK